MAIGHHRALGGRVLTVPAIILTMIVVIGAYFIARRFFFGMGDVSNLNGGYPWGIWVVFDVVIGTAIGCGGFAMALLVYILNRGRYHPLVRPALLGGLFGYTLGGMAVIVDLGRYWQAYNMVLPWYMQPNSVMLEVGLCVMAYVTVLWIEFAPAFLEKLGLANLKQKLERVMFVFVAVGVLLPTMHQSSLGTLLLIKSHALSPLWYTQLLPLLFWLSALTMGFAVVMFEATLVDHSFVVPSEQFLLQRLGRIVAGVTILWLVLRFATVTWNGAWGAAFAGGTVAAVFWVEIALFAFAAAVLATASGRASRRFTFLAATALLFGGSLYRLDAYLVAQNVGNGWSYFPSVPEMMVTIAMIALELLLYLVFIKTLPVVSAGHNTAHAGSAAAAPQAR